MRQLLSASLALVVLLMLRGEPVEARTQSVVTFGSRAGIVFLDSLGSTAAFKLFESLRAPVVNRLVSQTKIVAPADGTFRIACTGYSADYVCAIIIYRGEHASLDFKTDRIELTLPGDIARAYGSFFEARNSRFHFETEDGRLVIDWSPEQMHVLYPAR